MRPEAQLATDASHEMMQSLIRMLERAVRLELTGVGTEHLLFAVLKEDPAAGKLLAPGANAAGALLGIVAGKKPEQWVSADGSDAAASDSATALLHEAAKGASVSRKGPGVTAPPHTAGLAAAIDRALLSARELGASWANNTHLLMGLTHDPGNRACETLLERRLDRGEAVAGLAAHPSARQDGAPYTPSVDGLRNIGVLTQRGKIWGGLARKLSSGVFGSPVLPTVRLEADRQAVRLGHADTTTVHLLIAMLVLDDQLATTGSRLRDEFRQVNTGAELLRAQGVTTSDAARAATGTAPGDGVDKALTRARLRANEAGDPSTGTVHLLAALLDEPGGACEPLLASIGADTDGLRRTLGI